VRQQRDEAYVLRTRELGEADLIVSLLTRHSGKLRGVARAARASRRRFGGTLEPLTRVRAEWSEKAGRELHRIDELECLRSFAAMQADPPRQAACAVLVELVEAFAREGEADPRDFRLLGAVIEALEGGTDVWVALRYFEYWTLRLHGLLPDLGRCTACGTPLAPGRIAWVADDGGIRCTGCHGAAARAGRGLGGAERGFLEQASLLGPQALPAECPAALPGGALETLLRRTLEAYAERRFGTYRHLHALARWRAGGPRA
jgi:DNA repair protein RecO (recombination protein O)